MGRYSVYMVAVAVVVVLDIKGLTAGCSTHQGMHEELQEESRSAECVLATNSLTGAGAVHGTIYLHQQLATSSVNVTGTITGLSPGLHGFHVHQWGVAGADQGCNDAGAHYNPGGFNHAGPNDNERHVGDLGNIFSGEDHTAHVQIMDSVLTLWGGRSIMGRAIVVHEGEDDLGLGGYEDSLTTGHAGGRLACCTITLSN